jgi:hypothetical protein
MAHDQTLDADKRTIALSPLTKVGVHLWKLVVGDTWELHRTYTGLTAGATISKAYWTVKASATDTDANALYQVSITSTSTAAGQIIDGATNGGSIEMAFIATKTQTAALVPDQTYVYDVQVIDSLGQVYTLELGTICPQQGVTAATT